MSQCFTPCKARRHRKREFELHLRTFNGKPKLAPTKCYWVTLQGKQNGTARILGWWADAKKALVSSETKSENLKQN